MLGVGVGAYGAAIFHLTTHAFFKALLFLAAGSVMHALGGELDIRKMGGLRDKMPVTFRTFAIGAATLAGIPLLSGFFSKDAILLGALARNPALYAVGLFTALLTAFYSFRALFVPFFGAPRDPHLHDHAHESPSLMTVPLGILAVLSIFGGLLNLPFVLTMESWLEPAIGHHGEPSLTLELTAITLSMVVALFGFVMARARYVTGESWPRTLAARFTFFQPAVENKWYVDEFYMKTVVNPLRRLAGWFAGAIDQGVIDGAVNGVGRLSLDWGERVRRLQTGEIPTYALSILVGIVVVLVYFVFV
jgi:NADH-quinone oxidoreductase subunit L